MSRSAKIKWLSLPGVSACLALLAILSIHPFAAAAAKQGDGHGAMTSSLGGGFVIADLDGDRQPDLATVSVAQSNPNSTDYFICFRFSAEPDSTIGLSARGGGLSLAERDVNGDSIVDLVVSSALDSQIVAVLVNDGHGKFSLADPSKFPVWNLKAREFLESPQNSRQDLTGLPSPRNNLSDEPQESNLFHGPGKGNAIPQAEGANRLTAPFLCLPGRSPPHRFHSS